MGSTNREAGKGANRDGGEGKLAGKCKESLDNFNRRTSGSPSVSRRDLDRTGGRHVPNSGSPSPGKPCSK